MAAGRRRFSTTVSLVSLLLLLVSPAAPFAAQPNLLLVGFGDSLTQGTMDATNNALNTRHAYLQKIADSLAQVSTLTFSQPLFDVAEKRMQPFQIPTNVGVDGADSFSVEGIQYYQRAGVPTSFVTNAYLADALLPLGFQDKYDEVLYPINLKLQKPTSMVDSTVWLLNQSAGRSQPVVIFWIGNNDSSAAALGEGGSNPSFLPIPFEQAAPQLTPLARALLADALATGSLSFAPYTQASIDRNLTALADFVAQYTHLLSRLKSEVRPGAAAQLFLLTLPYYSSVGYLFDSDDLEYYLRKVNPRYVLPLSFKRVAPPGQPITDPTKGDRVSLLTFGFMYALLNSGYSVEYVNRALETNGQQRDGLVLSESEQAYIRTRIDAFNAAIRDAAAAYGPDAHIVEIGNYLNDALTGKTSIVIGGRTLTRKWIRGNSFSFDGVHPNYTGQALIANFVLGSLNATLGLAAPLHDLDATIAADPYIDRDGDGFAPGPGYAASGFNQLLFLFKDPNDASSASQVVLPPDVWQQISDILVQRLLGG